jgi:hypothetical protein
MKESNMPLHPNLLCYEIEGGSMGGSTMLVIGRNSITVKHDKEIMIKAFRSYASGNTIQEAFHFLTPTEREFMMTGMTEAEQNALFNESEG